MDRLTLFLSQFPVSAGVFHSGALPATAEFSSRASAGHLHVFREGCYSVYLHERPDINITEPSLLFCPKPLHHRLQPLTDGGGDVLCATVSLGDGGNSPITETLPDVITLPLRQMPSLDQVLGLLFSESTNDLCGRQFAQDRLAEYFLVLLLRELIDQNKVDGGMLAALADRRLARLIVAIQESPNRQWNLEEMAATAGMSRARFAAHFKEVMGMTPHQFLTDWRIALAQDRLRRGESLQAAAGAVGFSNSAALSRAFQQKLGMTAKAWVKAL